MEASGAERVLTELRLVEIGPNDLPAVWKAIEPLIERGCAYSGGALDPQSVVDGVLTGRAKLIALADEREINSVMALQVVAMPTGQRVLEVILVGGRDVEAWAPFEPQLDAIGLAEGCEKVRTMGRKGWARRLPHWRLSAIVLERDLVGR